MRLVCLNIHPELMFWNGVALGAEDRRSLRGGQESPCTDFIANKKFMDFFSPNTRRQYWRYFSKEYHSGSASNK